MREFAHPEPLAAWQRALAGKAPYRMWIRTERDGGAIIGGVAFELYPHSACGLITYLVVAPAARGRGLGRALHDDAVAALRAEGARAVLSEGGDARALLEAWGGQVLDYPYVQPALGPGLPRDPDLRLIAWGDVPRREVIDAFVGELYAATEG